MRNHWVKFLFVTLRRIKIVFDSPKLFTVVVAVENVCYITVQWEGQYSLTYSPTYRGAFLASWGSRECDIRSSRCYGQAKSKLKLKDLIPHKEVLITGKHSNYI